MRAVGWLVGGGITGVAAGLVAGLFRRSPVRPVPVGEPHAAYAGGYTPPTRSSNQAVADTDGPADGVARGGADTTAATTAATSTERSRTTPNG